MGVMGYVVVFSVMLVMALLGMYVALKAFSSGKFIRPRFRRKYEAQPLCPDEEDEEQVDEIPLDEEGNPLIPLIDDMDDVVNDPTPDTGGEERVSGTSPLSKIDKSASFTDMNCECEGMDEEDHIRHKLHQQDQKFGQKSRSKE